MRRVGMQDSCDARNLRGGLRGRRRVVADDEKRQLAADLLRGGDRVERRGVERRVVVIGKEQNGHEAFPITR